MKLISIFLFCLLLTPAVLAQTLEPENDPMNLIRPPQVLDPGGVIDKSQPIGPQVVKAYYEECVKQEHPAYSADELKLYCSCKAEKLPEDLSDAEMLVIFEESVAGQAARDKIAAFITPPCAKEPTANMAYRRCVLNETANREIKNYRKFCYCLSGGLGDFVADVAEKAAEVSLRRRPPPGDITTHIIDDYGYTQQYGYYTKKCLSQMGQ